MPGAADRILTMAEEGQRAIIEDKRAEAESRRVEAEALQIETKAHAFAVKVTVVSVSILPYILIGASLVLGINGETWPAVVTAIGGIIPAFAQLMKK